MHGHGPSPSCGNQRDEPFRMLRYQRIAPRHHVPHTTFFRTYSGVLFFSSWTPLYHGLTGKSSFFCFMWHRLAACGAYIGGFFYGPEDFPLIAIDVTKINTSGCFVTPASLLQANRTVCPPVTRGTLGLHNFWSIHDIPSFVYSRSSGQSAP